MSLYEARLFWIGAALIVVIAVEIALLVYLFDELAGLHLSPPYWLKILYERLQDLVQKVEN